MEQDLKMRIIEDKLREGYDNHKEDIITLFLALQRQTFVLSNSLTNLVEKWQEREILMDLNTTKEVLPMFGILLETKD